MDLHDNAKKVVVCSALFAGFAYFSLSILRNVFSNHKKASTTDRHNRKASQSVQTDVTVPAKEDKKWCKLSPEMWGPWAKTIQDRIKELNLKAAASGVVLKQGRIPSITANPSSLSSHNTPRHSPRTRSPTRLANQNNLSQSVDNLSKDLSYLPNGPVTDGHSIPTIIPPNETEMANYKKILDTLFGQKNPNLSQQEASVLGMLLMSDDDELLVKTFSVIADCAVFTPNINIICDSGCLVMLLHLLNTNSEPSVVAAATQAIGNLANGERAQELMKPFIIPLMNKLKTSSHLQLTWSLLALANLAHKESNHTDFLDHLNELTALLEKGCSRVQLQTLKILVNLSCNQNSIVYILASKCPSNFHTLLEPTTDEEILIRLCSFICNLVEAVFRRNIRHQHLPTINKVASPETLYTGIFGVQSIEILKEKLTSLARYPNENVTSTVHRIQKKLISL